MREPPKIESLFYYSEPEASVQVFGYQEDGSIQMYYFQIRFTYDQEWNDASSLYLDPLTCTFDAYESFRYIIEKYKGMD